MRTVSLEIGILLFGILIVICHTETTTQGAISRLTAYRQCQNRQNGQQLCFCGENKELYDRLKEEKCINGQIVRKRYANRTTDQPLPKETAISFSAPSNLAGLRLTTKAIHQSTRDDNKEARCTGLIFKPSLVASEKAYVPLRNVSVEAWIDSFAADVTLTQVFVNEEKTNIEAVYVFPIEENAAVYSFTAQIDNRTITALLKEKKVAEKEYESAVQQGQTAVLMRQSENTLDTFTINIGALPPGKECRVKIQYVTELDLVDGSSIRFVVPTTIAPRYNPSLGHLQSPDNTKSEYVQKTPYSMWFQAHILRGEEYKITQVANLSHSVNISMSHQSIDISTESIALDRDIILDIDLPKNRSMTMVAMEQSNDTSKHAILLAFTPTLADIMNISKGPDETNTEFIFIVDCSGSMEEADKIGLAREAMLLFIRSLPVGAHFNILRFGSDFDILFKSEAMTTVYNEQTAKTAENLTRSMAADFGGTELLGPLKHLKSHPPVHGRSRQIFLLTDGEISNTDEVIELCRSMSSTTRIFSFGLGHSPSRSLVKGLARATNGHFVFVPPGAKVDTYVGTQFGRALQPSIVNAQLKWHGLSINGSQAPKTIPPIYVNDRVLVYELLDSDNFAKHNVSVDLMVGELKIGSIKLPKSITPKKDTIRRLAAKASIQELQHEKPDAQNQEINSTLEQRITALSMNHQILSPYTAFVGVETTGPKNNNTQSKVRHIPIQISKGDEHLFNLQAMGSIDWLSPIAYHRPMKSHSNHRFNYNPNGFPDTNGMFGGIYNWYMAKDVIANSGSVLTTTIGSYLSTDPVRWLIDQQSFNGAWSLNDTNIVQLTNGKSLSAFTSTVTKSKDALTTALVIAVLESKYADQKNLWYAVVAKGRKQLHNSGLSNDQVDALINEIKKNL